MMGNNYGAATGQAFNDYNNLMGQYQNFASGGGGGGGSVGLDPYYQGLFNKGTEGYSNFADTGGFNPQDIQDIRARAIAPTRAVYANAQDNINRQRALQGGYSPNYTAATAKMARNVSSDISDQNVNANASIANMIQQGKLAGLGGLSSNAQNGMQMALQAAQANQSAGSAARGQNLGALNAMQNLYEATPGLANMFGNQLLNSNNQLLGSQGQSNQMGLGLINGRLGASQVPGDFQQGMGNIGSVFGAIGSGVGALSGLKGLGDANKLFY